MKKKELIGYIDDLLKGETEYHLDKNFPRKTFETFMKEYAK